MNASGGVSLLTYRCISICIHRYMYMEIYMHGKIRCTVVLNTLHSTVLPSRWLFYIQGQAHEALSLAFSRSERMERGKGLGKVCRGLGLSKLIRLSLQASCPWEAFASMWLQDKDLFGHKLLVTNCAVTLGERTRSVVHSLHTAHSVYSTASVLFLSCHATFSSLLTFLMALLFHSISPSSSLRHAVSPPASSPVKPEWRGLIGSDRIQRPCVLKCPLQNLDKGLA